MIKQRFFLFIYSILYAFSAFSQHPHSRGGEGPFYWAIVGGLAAALWYVVSLILGNFKEICAFFKKTLRIPRREKMNSKKQKSQIAVMGTPIDSSNHGESDQKNSQWENGQDAIHDKSYQSKEHYKENQGDEEIKIESNSSSIAKINDKNKRKKSNIIKRLFWLFLIVCSVSAVIIGFVIYVYDNQKKANEHQENAKTIMVDQDKVINREFLVFKFKDTKSEVINTLKSRNLICKSSSCDSAINVCELVYANVKYGDKRIDTLLLSFYKDRLFRVKMRFNITYQDQVNNWTFNRFETLFRKKRYQIDYGAERYNNVRLYADRYTRLKLWHSFETYSSDNPSVCLTYYDKTSGYEEAMNQGF